MKQIKAYAIAAIFTFTSTGFGAATEVGTSKSPTPAKASGPSITDSSKDAAKDNKMGQIMNMAIGGVNLATGAYCASQCSGAGGGCCSMAPIFFLMGMQNMMQSGAQGKSGGQANGAVYSTDTGLGSSGYDPDLAALGSDPEIKAGNDFASTVAQGKAGFTYDPKTNTVTTAKGTKIKGSDLNSSSALAAAGVPSSAIDMMKSMESDIVAKATKKVEKLGMNTNVVSGEESSGGGGGGSGSSGSGGGADAAAYGLAGRGAGLGVDRDPAQVAGMQKNYNGEPIGVAGDSIFKMMTRRYKVKESQSTFLDEADTLLQK